MNCPKYKNLTIDQKLICKGLGGYKQFKFWWYRIKEREREIDKRLLDLLEGGSKTSYDYSNNIPICNPTTMPSNHVSSPDQQYGC